MTINEARRQYGLFRLEDQDAVYAGSRSADTLLQVAIGVMTLTALWLLTSDSPIARWGHVVGLASQPFYIAATWRARQWGMFVVAVMLVGVWSRGIVNTFF